MSCSAVHAVLSRCGLALTFAVMAAALVQPARSSQPSRTTVFIDSASATDGQLVRSQVVASLAVTDSLEGFELDLSFDPALIEPVDIAVAPGWSEVASEPGGNASGTVTISGRRESATCTGGGTCLLASVVWRFPGSADAAIVLRRAELHADDGRPLDVTTIDGAVVRLTPRAPVTSTTGGTSIGLGDALVGVVVVLLVATALATPIAVWGLNRRKRAERDRLDQFPDLVETAVGIYLASFESAGQIDEPVDAFYERVAREGAGVSSTPMMNRSGGPPRKSHQFETRDEV